MPALAPLAPLLQQFCVFLSVEARGDLIMSNQQPRGPPDASTTEREPTESADEREHDCQQHLEPSIFG